MEKKKTNPPLESQCGIRKGLMGTFLLETRMKVTVDGL